MSRAKRRRRKRREPLPKIAKTIYVGGPSPIKDITIDGYPMKGPDGQFGMAVTLAITGGRPPQSLSDWLRECAQYFDSRPQILRDGIGQCLVVNADGDERFIDVKS